MAKKKKYPKRRIRLTVFLIAFACILAALFGLFKLKAHNEAVRRGLAPTPTHSASPIGDHYQNWVTYTLHDDIYIMDTTTKKETQLTTYGANYEPTFSEDGQWILYKSIPQEKLQPSMSIFYYEYVQKENNEPIEYRYWVIKTDGTGAHKVAGGKLMNTVHWRGNDIEHFENAIDLNGETKTKAFIYNRETDAIVQ